jgi:hypothetical protein
MNLGAAWRIIVAAGRVIGVILRVIFRSGKDVDDDPSAPE